MSDAKESRILSLYTIGHGPDLQNILRQSYDNAKVTIDLPTYNGRLICKTSYEERKAFLRCNSLANS